MGAIGRTMIDGIALQDMKLVDITSNVLGKRRDHRLKVDKVLGLVGRSRSQPVIARVCCSGKGMEVDRCVAND